VADVDEELVAHGAEEPFDLASALGAAGREWMSRIPNDAQARSSWADTNGLPLSRYTAPGTPREANPARKAPSARSVSSAVTHR